MNRMECRAAVLLAVLAATGCGVPDREPPRVVSVCELSNNYAAHHGTLVAVRGVYYEGSLRQACPAACAIGPWPSFINLAATDYVAPGEEPFGFATDQPSWDTADLAECVAQREAERGKPIEVWVTVIGRLRAAPKSSPLGPCDIAAHGSYGHLGAFPAELVVQRIKDVRLVPNANSPYEYRYRPPRAM